MSIFRKGDKVKSHRIFEVDAVDHLGRVFDKHGNAHLDGDLTLVERRTYEVGDVIESRLELRDLPVNSVVVNCYDQPMIVRRSGTFSYDGVLHPFTARNNAPYRVVYVP